jgi:hypothetical protein
VDGRDVVRISDIIETLNEAAIHSLERDDSGELAVIVTLAQFALEHMHATVGYTYAHWFDVKYHKSISQNMQLKTLFFFLVIGYFYQSKDFGTNQTYGFDLYQDSSANAALRIG